MELRPGLSDIASLFLEIQAERHKADYKINHTLRRSEVRMLVRRVEKEFDEW